MIGLIDDFKARLGLLRRNMSGVTSHSDNPLWRARRGCRLLFSLSGERETTGNRRDRNSSVSLSRNYVRDVVEQEHVGGEFVRAGQSHSAVSVFVLTTDNFRRLFRGAA